MFKSLDLSKYAFDKLKFEAIGKWIASVVIYQQTHVLKDAAVVSWDVSQRYNTKVTLTGSRTLSIIGAVPGTYGTIEIVQGGSGSYTLTLPSNSKVANGGTGALTLSTIVGSIDIATFYYNGTTFNWTYSTNFT